MFDLCIINTGQRTHMPLENCQGNYLYLILTSSRCKPYFLLSSGSIYILWSVRASNLVCLGHRTQFLQAKQANTNVTFLPCMFFSWLMVNSFQKRCFLAASLWSWAFFASLVVKFNGQSVEEIPVVLISSVAAFACSVSSSLKDILPCARALRVPRNGMVLHKSCIKHQWQICSMDWE